MTYFWDMSVNVVAEYKNYKNEVVAQLTDNMTYITDSFYDSPNKFTDGNCNGDAICAYYQPVGKDIEFKNEKVTLQGTVPAWVKGQLINSNPSWHEVGKYHVWNYLDGYIRINNYRIDGNDLSVSSKLIDDTKYYTHSEKAGEPEMTLFQYPTPKRLADRVPGIAFGWCTGFGGTVSICDNIGIMPYRLPDGKTFVYLTDYSDWLLFNPEDLTTQGWLEWNIEDYGSNVPTGTTHIVNDVGSTDTIGLLCAFDTGITGTKATMSFYKVQADDINNRIPIGSMDVGKDMPYFHSFGHTADYLIFPRNSSNFNLAGMFEGKPMIDNFIFDYDNHLDFYIMNKADGTYK
jgi:carotenoid cleavage dioxygenase-like enzyme